MMDEIACVSEASIRATIVERRFQVGEDGESMRYDPLRIDVHLV